MTLVDIDIVFTYPQGFEYGVSVQPALGTCPICGQRLHVAEYGCDSCGVTLRGDFDRCDLCALPADLMHFVRVFLHAHGNLKEVERQIGLSYPTIKARLAAVNASLDAPVPRPRPAGDRLRLLEQLRDGDLDVDEVLRGLGRG